MTISDIPAIVTGEQMFAKNTSSPGGHRGTTSRVSRTSCMRRAADSKARNLTGWLPAE